MFEQWLYFYTVFQLGSSIVFYCVAKPVWRVMPWIRVALNTGTRWSERMEMDVA